MNSSSSSSCPLSMASSRASSSDYGLSCSSGSLSVTRDHDRVGSTNDDVPVITLLDQETETMSSKSDFMVDCRDFYDRRIQSLERFRRCQKTHSTSEESRTEKEEQPDVVLTRLKSDMVSLMESDIGLTRQLLALGERIAQLKQLTSSDHASPIYGSLRGLSSSSSMVSLDGIDEEDLKSIDDDPEVTMLTMAPLAVSCSDDGDGEDDEENEPLGEDSVEEILYSIPKKEYFSRQNSILRIPIPPSRGRVSRPLSEYRTSASIIKRASNGSASTTSSSDGDGTSSGVSSCSSSASRGGWCSKKRSTTNKVDRVRVVSTGSMPSLNVRLATSHQHASQESCDFGIHHNGMEMLDKEELVLV